ncbi:MAG: hypothetical protein QM667_04890 [Asticcacaulis sp.]
MANGALAVLSHHNDGTSDLLNIEVVDGQVSAIYFVRNPDKLRRFQGPI